MDIASESNDHQADKEPTRAPTPASERVNAGRSRAETPLIPSAPVAVAPPTPGSADLKAADDDDDPNSDSEEGQEPDEDLSEGMRKLSINSPPLRYHGKSSGLVFLRSALALKNEYLGFRPPPKGDGQPPVSEPSCGRIPLDFAVH